MSDSPFSPPNPQTRSSAASHPHLRWSMSEPNPLSWSAPANSGDDEAVFGYRLNSMQPSNGDHPVSLSRQASDQTNYARPWSPPALGSTDSPIRPPSPPPQHWTFSPLPALGSNSPPILFDGSGASSPPATSPSTFVDLTEEPDPTMPPVLRDRKRPAQANTSSASPPVPNGEGPTRPLKRQKPTETEGATKTEPIEAIDLVDDDEPLAQTLQKQRQDLIKSQSENTSQPPRLTTLSCIICMDTPTDLTATSCGHLFCHTCLMEALIAGENSAGPGESKRSKCPVCRKALSRKRQYDITPLTIMKKGMATQPRKPTGTKGS